MSARRGRGGRCRAGLLAAAVVLASSAGGCAQAPVTPDRFYRLLPGDAPAGRAVPALDGTLLVKRFQADGALADRAIAWVDAAKLQVLQQYHYHFWNDAPTRLVQELAVEVLRAGGAARTVVVPGMELDAAYTLTGRIHRLEHETGAEPAGAVSLELALYGDEPPRALLIERYQARREADADGIDAAVAAINAALLEVFERFLADLRQR